VLSSLSPAPVGLFEPMHGPNVLPWCTTIHSSIWHDQAMPALGRFDQIDALEELSTRLMDSCCGLACRSGSMMRSKEGKSVPPQPKKTRGTRPSVAGRRST
jgi:hypothetical protein